MIWNGKYETMGREDLAQVQIERLQSMLNRARRNVAFARQAFERAGVKVEDVRRLADLAALPFTTRDDLRAAYPYDMFAVPLRDIVRIQCTSGTTGRPVVVGYTPNDVRTWSECVARVLAAGGVTEHDVVQVAYTYGLFSGGLGFHYGAERIGASVVPASTGVARAPGHDHARLQDLGARLHARLRAGPRGRPRRRRHRGREPEPPRGLLRRRALERGAARDSSSRASASTRWTPTASPRCSGPGSPSSARSAAACT